MLDKTKHTVDDQGLIDPVCGMSVTENSEHHHHYKDKEYYFCSTSCHDKFQVSPDKYLSILSDGALQQLDEAGHHSTETYTCPMHPEIEQQGPGACPKCGMALELKGLPAAAKTEYTCPMHPEIVQDHPGSCPKCGMALEPRAVEAEEDTSELEFMSLRFWVSALLSIPVFFSAMAAEFWPGAMAEVISPGLRQWIEMVLATPVVVWGGWIFYVRCWQSLVTRNLKTRLPIHSFKHSIAFQKKSIHQGEPYPRIIFNYQYCLHTQTLGEGLLQNAFHSPPEFPN